MFRETSGGVTNPAVILARIIWQEFTLPVNKDEENSQWTYVYAASFVLGPVTGAMLAGVTFNMLQSAIAKRIAYKKKKKS